MTSPDDLARYVDPDGTLTAEGLALNATGQSYMRAVFGQLVADFRPKPNGIAVPAVPAVPDVSGSRGSAPPPRNLGTATAPAGIWMGALLEQEEAEILWTINGLLPMGGTMLLSGRPKAGKTTLLRCAMLALARGDEIIGRQCIKGVVVAFSLEDSLRKVRSHMADIGANPDDRILWFGPDDLPTKQGERLDMLEAVIKEHEPVAVTIDTLFDFLMVKDSNDYAEGKRVFAPLRNIARRSDVAIISTHHLPKAGDDPLGSTAWEGGPDTIAALKVSGDTRTMLTKQREGEAMPETVLRHTPTGWVERAGLKADIAARDIDDQILSILDGEMKTDDIIEATGRRKDEVLKAIRRLTSSGLVGCRREGQTRYYFPAVPAPPL